jgi:hypothetical protein
VAEVVAASRVTFDTVVAWLEGDAAAGLEHVELEAELDGRVGRGAVADRKRRPRLSGRSDGTS